MAETVVGAARAALGPVGVMLPVSFTATPGIEAQRDAVVRLERAGIRAAWTNEVIGKDALVQLGVLLAATRDLVVGTGIANIWARPPQTMRAASATLAEAYPGRLVLGIGAGYAEQAAAVGRDYGRPLPTVRAYLDAMDTPTSPPAPAVEVPRILGANGPKMLALAGERADGALPAGIPPSVTARDRAALGPDKLLVIGMTVIPDDDLERARTAARATVSGLLGWGWFAQMVEQLGYTEDQIRDVDDALVDDFVAHGDAPRIAAAVRAHLAAGADHVILMLPSGEGGEFTAGVDRLVALAGALRARE